MKGKKGSIKIDIPSATKSNKQPGSGKEFGYGDAFSCKAWLCSVWDFCKEDSNNVIFALKVGLAVLLVSLLILFRGPYEIFGTNIIWSILTVAIMFEYTVGKRQIIHACMHSFMLMLLFKKKKLSYWEDCLKYMYAVTSVTGRHRRL